MKRCTALVLALFALAATAAGEERRADVPLVVNGDVSLTTTDYKAYLEKVPQQLRDDFSSGSERVKKTVDGLWVQRMVARRARAGGLADDPVVAARLVQAQEAVLVEVFLRNLEKEMKYPDLLPRAREIYRAQPEKFREPGKVQVQHILVDMKCRKRDEALKRAQEVRAEALAGKEDFKALARRLSDDASKDRNGGDLGLVAPSVFDEQFRTAIEKLSRPGEVSEPIETRFGFHVVKFVKREPARLKPFEEVKDGIIAAEKQLLLDEARAQVLLSVRNDPKTHLYLENVEALVEAPKASAPGTETKAR